MDNSNRNHDDKATAIRMRWLFLILSSLPLVGLVMIACCATSFIIKNPDGQSLSLEWFYPTIGHGVLVGGAAYVIGAFSGFLFGLPRYLVNPDSFSKNYSRNDNLIQISDWLTKIIVGLGLANLYKIPSLLHQMGNNLQVLFGDTPKGAVLGEAIVLYFLTSGFLLGYLWTNIQYIPILTQMDQVTKNLAKEIQTKETLANEAIDGSSTSFSATDVNAFDKVEKAQQQFPTGRAPILSYSEFSGLLALAKERFDKGMEEQKAKPDALKDPNRGHWGGKAENNNRRITAMVEPMANDKDLFRVTLQVKAIEGRLMDGELVIFALHNTFRDPIRAVLVKDGAATLEVISYGAFTVGTLCDNGKTELEYDLAALSTAPEKFRNS